MRTRIITGLVMAIVGIPLLIFAPKEVFIGVAALFSIIAAYEIIHMFENKSEVKISFVGKTVIYTLVAFENLIISLSWYFYNKNNTKKQKK